jgi:hypothetical protein
MRSNASLAVTIRVVSYEDTDDVGIDQAPDLGFAFREITVQAGGLQSDRRLRGE